MRMSMLKTSLILLGLIILFSSQGFGQRKLQFDKVPLDTLKWKATDTLFLNLNNDGIDDLLLVYNKYKGLTRPNNIQAPILIFLAKRKTEFVFFKKAERLVCLPDFKVTATQQGFQVLQKGIRNDRNWYTVFCKKIGNDIIVHKELVEEHVLRLKKDDKTNVLTESDQANKIYSAEKATSISTYNCTELVSRYNR